MLWLELIMLCGLGLGLDRSGGWMRIDDGLGGVW